MDPVTIAMLIATATSAIQGIAGGAQLRKANKLEEQYPRPTATTSDAINRLAGYSFGRTLDQDIPGGELYRNQIRGATASGIDAATRLSSGAEAFGQLGNLVRGEQAAYGEQSKLLASLVREAQNSYMNVLSGPVYQEERRVDYWNREMPYLQAAQAARELRGAGWQNMMAGVKNVGGTLAEYLGGRGHSTGSDVSMDDIGEYIKKYLDFGNLNNFNTPGMYMDSAVPKREGGISTGNYYG